MNEVAHHPLLNLPYRLVTAVGSLILHYVRDWIQFLEFFKEILVWSIKPPYRWTLLLSQMEYIGNQSLNILIGGGIAVGAVFGLQIGAIFRVFSAESMMGAVTGKALCQEIAPLVTTILITGRAGAAMAAEIATMRVNEQVDAMEAMAVDPISYLVVPRFLASLVILPLLCAVFIFVGVIGSYIAGHFLFNIDEGMFMQKITTLVETKDIWRGISKAFAFSGLMTAICCRSGLRASGGAKGVGIATTNAVVSTLLAILAVDVVMTYFQVIW